MKVDIVKLLVVFDELIIQATNEEQGVYWFRTIREDNLIVTFSFPSMKIMLVCLFIISQIQLLQI